jgi:hypothetical protein
MEDADLGKYKSAWKEEKNFSQKKLSETDIKMYLNKRSSEISRSFRTGIIFDIILKTALVISFIVISRLLTGNSGIVWICIFSGIIIISLILFQVDTYRKIPKQNEYSVNTRDFLESKIKFYRGRYFKSVYVAALSNPFIFLSGSLLYYYIKYGVISTFQYIDYIIFGLFCLTGFILGAVAQIKFFNFQITQLESCLYDLDENGMDELKIKKQLSQRKKVFLIFLLLLVSGLLILGYFLAG